MTSEQYQSLTKEQRVTLADTLSSHTNTKVDEITLAFVSIDKIIDALDSCGCQTCRDTLKVLGYQVFTHEDFKSGRIYYQGCAPANITIKSRD